MCVYLILCAIIILHCVRFICTVFVPGDFLPCSLTDLSLLLCASTVLLSAPAAFLVCSTSTLTGLSTAYLYQN
jgi:hypothetical protein